VNRPLNVLFLEDSEDDVLLVSRHLTRAGFTVETRRVDTPDDFQSALRSGSWDVVISDYSLPGLNALAAIENISDDAIFLKKLREFADDHGPLIPLLHDINAYPKAAKVLNDFTTSKLAAALKNPPKGIKS